VAAQAPQQRRQQVEPDEAPQRAWMQQLLQLLPPGCSAWQGRHSWARPLLRRSLLVLLSSPRCRLHCRPVLVVLRSGLQCG